MIHIHRIYLIAWPSPNLFRLIMTTQLDNDFDIKLSGRSPVYRELMEEKKQILEHKWLESEKAGEDIGYEKALFSWIRHHRTQWLRVRRSSPSESLKD